MKNTDLLAPLRAESHAWGAALERAARTLTMAISVAYVAGLLLGRGIHYLNDALAAATGAPTPALAPAAPTPAPARLTVPQLRTLARRRLGSATRIGDRRIAQATRTALLAALQLQEVDAGAICRRPRTA